MNTTERSFVLLGILGDLFLLKFSTFVVQIFLLVLMYGFPWSYGAGILKTFFPSLISDPVRFAIELAGILLFFTLPFAIAGLYRLRVTRSIFVEWRRLFLMVVLSSLMLFVVIGVASMTSFDPLQYLLFVVTAAVLLGVWRYLLRAIQRLLVRFFGSGVRRLVIIDDPEKEISGAIRRDLERASWFGYKLVAIATGVDIADLEERHARGGVDDILHVAQRSKPEDVKKLMDFCDAKKILYQYVPNILQSRTTRFDTSSLAGYPVISVRVPLAGLWRSRIAKRVFDILASVLFIVVSIPIYLATAIAVKATSKGPIFFVHERIGRKRKVFRYLQFRSMKIEHCTSGQNPDVERALAYERELIETKNTRKGPLYKIQDDPRLTSIGAFIRKYSIDEWPSALNVLLGHMSWVGPRPHQVREVEKYPAGVDRLFDVKPGVTGLPQISGRSDLSFEEELRLDLHYIENWSFWGDIAILLKTPKALLAKRKVH